MAGAEQTSPPRTSLIHPAVALTVLFTTVLLAISLAHAVAIDVPGRSILSPVAGGLALAASVLAWLRWRILGDGASALFGVAFLALCIGIVQPEDLPRAVSGTSAVDPDVVRVAIVAFVVLACWGAVRTEQVDTGLQVGRWVAAVAALALVATALTAAIDLDRTAASTWAVVNALVTISLLVAALGVRARLRDRSTTGSWVSATLAVLAVAQACQVAALISGLPWLVGYELARTIALLLAVAGAVKDLDTAYQDQRDRLFGTVVDQRVADARQQGMQILRAGQSHEARTSMTAIDGAARVLGDHAQDLDGQTRQRLRTAVSGQIARLQVLLTTTEEEDATPVPLDALLSRVLRELRMRGVTVHTDISPDLIVRARPADTVAVLHTAVDQCASSGHDVHLSAHATQAWVRLRIHRSQDAGEGVGTAVAVGGLDLAVCTRLMQAQGGLMHHIPHSDTFELALPRHVASSTTPTAPSTQPSALGEGS